VPITAPRDRVWAFVTDPDQVGQCAPGVDSIEMVDPTHFQVSSKIGIGFIRARFVLNLEFAELEPPERAVIKAHGQAPGTAVDGTADMRLSEGPAAGTSVMDWSAEVVITGALASAGAKMIEGTADKMIGQAFDCIRAKLEA
jgi:carbon monoxide dehydrogenase subunit G